MTEVGMAHSSVMFLNQDGRAPISTHPARAHKHAASQLVPPHMWEWALIPNAELTLRKSTP
jgi:hypothetical protein